MRGSYEEPIARVQVPRASGTAVWTGAPWRSHIAVRSAAVISPATLLPLLVVIAAYDRYASTLLDGILAIAKAVRAVGNPDDKEGFIKALEGMEIELPEDPVGFRPRNNPETHQIIQMQAIGIVVRDARYPPATALLGNLQVYPAERLLPSRVEIARRREAVGAARNMRRPAPAN